METNSLLNGKIQFKMTFEIKISQKPVGYKYAEKLMEKRLEDVKKGKKSDFIWILEHSKTFTAGTSSNEKDLLDKKIRVIKVKRGGKITLHNKGQKILYFVIDLNKKKKDIRLFINIIEKAIIDFLKIYNIKSYSDRKNIGIWVDGKKIAAIGIRISKWVAYHGFSINIKNNLNDYKKINPCGLSNEKITSIYDLKNKTVKYVEKNLLNSFLKNIKNF